MKRIISSMIVFTALFSACNKKEDCTICYAEPAVLEITLCLEQEPTTKATAYLSSQTYEKQVNNVQILVFDSSGALNIYKDVGTATSGISINTTTGPKTIWAVINGPSLASIKTLSALRNTAVDLSNNSTTASEGFVMSGSSEITVGSASTSVSIQVERLLSRVALQKITNSLPASYGTMTINNVCLTNVVGNQNLAGAATISTWYNKMGRKDGATASSQIIDGSTYLASHPTLTFKSVESSVASGASHTPTTPYLFYTFPNSTGNDVTGWATSFTARKTRLVVAATIGGKKYYYPVVIDTPSRNNAYTVELTITGLGSPDPDTPVVKGSVNASITVLGWTSGTVYEEII